VRPWINLQDSSRPSRGVVTNEHHQSAQLHKCPSAGGEERKKSGGSKAMKPDPEVVVARVLNVAARRNPAAAAPGRSRRTGMPSKAGEGVAEHRGEGRQGNQESRPTPQAGGIGSVDQVAAAKNGTAGEKSSAVPCHQPRPQDQETAPPSAQWRRSRCLKSASTAPLLPLNGESRCRRKESTEMTRPPDQADRANPAHQGKSGPARAGRVQGLGLNIAGRSGAPESGPS